MRCTADFYEHHWSRPQKLDPDRFELFLDDLSALLPRTGCGLSYGTEDGPCIGSEVVAFNGELEDEEQAGDDFIIERDVSGLAPELYNADGSYPDYCDTRGFAYDRCVRLALVALAVRFPEARVDRSADLRGWAEAWRSYEQVVIGRRLKVRERHDLRTFLALGGRTRGMGRQMNLDHLTYAWSRPVTLGRERFRAFAGTAERLARLSGLEVADSSGEGEPSFTGDVVSFNPPGKELLDGTRVVIERDASWPGSDAEGDHAKGIDSSYCITHRGAYDTLVRAILLALKLTFPEAEITNDAPGEMWLDAWDLYRRAGASPALTEIQRERYLSHVELGGDPCADPASSR